MAGTFKGRNSISIDINLDQKSWDNFAKSAQSFIDKMGDIELGFNESDYMQIRDLWSSLQSQFKDLTSSPYDNVNAKIAEIWNPINSFLEENKTLFDKMMVKFKGIETPSVGFEEIFSEANKYLIPEFAAIEDSATDAKTSYDGIVKDTE